MQDQTISKYYTDDNKSKYSQNIINLKYIIKSTKNFMKNFAPTRQAATTEFLSKIPNRNKIYNERFDFEAKISLDDIIKSINSHTNNKFPGNDGLTAEFYIYISNELALSF